LVALLLLLLLMVVMMRQRWWWRWRRRLVQPETLHCSLLPFFHGLGGLCLVVDLQQAASSRPPAVKRGLFLFWKVGVGSDKISR
jgi:hypothetical protein